VEASTPASTDGRRKRLVPVAAIMGSFVAGLDATAVNVALPAIRNDLGVSGARRRCRSEQVVCPTH